MKAFAPWEFSLYALSGLCLALPLAAEAAKATVFNEERQTVWEAVLASLAERGEQVRAVRETVGSIQTEVVLVGVERLRQVIKEVYEESDWDQGRYRLEITLSSRGGRLTEVTVDARIECYGRPHRRMGVPPGWWACPSNGRLEEEFLTAIRKRVGGRRGGGQ